MTTKHEYKVTVNGKVAKTISDADFAIATRKARVADETMVCGDLFDDDEALSAFVAAIYQNPKADRFAYCGQVWRLAHYLVTFDADGVEISRTILAD